MCQGTFKKTFKFEAGTTLKGILEPKLGTKFKSEGKTTLGPYIPRQSRVLGGVLPSGSLVNWNRFFWELKVLENCKF